jgi:peptide chain release factor 1
MSDLLDKLNTVETRYERLMDLVADPAVQADPTEYKKHAKALAEIQDLVEHSRRYRAVLADLAQVEDLLRSGDEEMQALAREEMSALSTRRDELLQAIKVLLVPRDPNDEKNVVLEIRAGEGGDEAGLFAAELFRMYRGAPTVEA